MSRNQMLNEGILIDVSHLAKQIHYNYPVAVTIMVMLHINNNLGLIWDLLNLLYFKIKQERLDSKTFFETTIGVYTAVCEPDEEGKPVMTIMLSSETENIKNIKLG